MKSNYLKTLLVVAISTTFQSCVSETQSTHDHRSTWNKLMESHGYEYVLLTEEERQEKWRTLKLFFGNTQIVENVVVFNLTKEDFIKQGLPGEYYDFCMENIVGVNETPDSLIVKQELLKNFDAIKVIVLTTIDSLQRK
jgi:hypothetical protein